MNTSLAPFNNLKARQAVNYAVDRAAAVRLFGGTQPRHAELPDPAGRVPGPRRLLPVHEEPGREVVGTRPGEGQGARQGSRARPARRSRSSSRTTRSTRPIGTYLQSVLNQLGWKASLKVLSSTPPVHLHPEHQEPRADQPQPVVPGLPGGVGLPERAASAARSFRPGSDTSINIAGFCNKTIQSQMDKAEALGADEHRRPRNALWAKIDKQVTDQSPAAVLFDPKNIDFVSKRVGNFTFSDQYYMLRRPGVGAVTRELDAATRVSGAVETIELGGAGASTPRRRPQPVRARAASPAAQPDGDGLARRLPARRHRLRRGADLRARHRAHRPVHLERQRARRS